MGAATPPVTVRPLEWTDFDDLTSIYYQLYEERASHPDIGIHLFRERPGPADEARWFSALWGRVLAGNAIVRVAEVGERVVGNCTVGRGGDGAESEMSHVGELGILVHRDHRGRGIGSALLSATLGACRGRFDVVRLSVFSVNEGARRLYERFGFLPYGRLPAAVHRGDRYLDLDLLWLDLRRPSAKG